MTVVALPPRKSLNKAYLKLKPTRGEMERFKTGLTTLLDNINEAESEEHHKNLVITFLKGTGFAPKFFINTKGRTDLVIHAGIDAKSAARVLIEVKKPSNKTEMITPENLNAKAFHELILYYLRERITGKNLGIKHIIVTNIYEWHIFDATLFEKLFAQDKKLLKKFKDFEEGRLSGTGTEFFYKEIAAPLLADKRASGQADESSVHSPQYAIPKNHSPLTAHHSPFSFTHFNLRNYEKPLRNTNRTDDTKLIALLKVLSPEHLLKLPFANDSNTLDRGFYAELLHIIGLAETKQGSKKVIGRKGNSKFEIRNSEQETRNTKRETQNAKRDPGALLENIIVQLESHDKISRLANPSQFGENEEERLFNVALELVITWINRILFLKLLEAQLVAYHKGDQDYEFLNSKKIRDFDDLDKLYFQILNRKQEDRISNIQDLGSRIQDQFANVPYLNSTLFEPTELEHQTIFISNLDDSLFLPILPSTILKDANGKRIKGSMNTLEYLFAFLDAYDFSSEGSEEIQEENKTLINASVLGLIFEKLNGYKDGSFFTPGFITMYMCRETIRRAVVEKFAPPQPSPEGEGAGAQKRYSSLDDIYNAIDKDFTKKQANDFINSLKICDPAVGSGHFLVSALNEIIAIKSELKILMDRQGKVLRDYHVEVVNDELVVTDEDGNLFEYNPNNPESQRIQETLFHEKQTLIENCLFGVDINPNSVKICRLRLWIELLKNAYYVNERTSGQADKRTSGQADKRTSGQVHSPQSTVHNHESPVTSHQSQTLRELQTLPNIDINIKCGNSLISRYALDADLKEALKKSRFSIESYRVAIMTYRNATNKEQKREMEKLIDTIKNSFQTEISQNDPKKKRLDKLVNELYHRFTGHFLFEPEEEYGNEKLKEARKKEQKKLEDEITRLSKEIEDIKTIKIFDNAFEWRFEFPEVLDDDGRFLGFDVIIGNPPYVSSKEERISNNFKQYAIINYETSKYQIDTYILFIEKALSLISPKGSLTLIVPNSWLNNLFLKDARKFFLENLEIQEICYMPIGVFNEAVVDTIILSGYKQRKDGKIHVKKCIDNQFIPYFTYPQNDFLKADNYCINIHIDKKIRDLLRKIETNALSLESITSIARGVGIYHKRVGHTKEFISRDPYQANIRKDKTFVPYLKGKNIRPYSIRWEQDCFLSYGNWLAEPRALKYFEGDRILVRQIPSSKLIATFLDQRFITDQSVFIARFETSEYSPKAVLAVIASSLMSFYFRNKYGEFDSLFPKLKLQNFKLFPINGKQKEYEKDLEKIVDQILSLKRSDPSADTSALEEEIDRMVYGLYGLTEEEIEVVEGRG